MLPRPRATSLPSWVWAISGLRWDLGLSKAVCGKVGFAHERFYDEMEVMRLLMGTGRAYERG